MTEVSMLRAWLVGIGAVGLLAGSVPAVQAQDLTDVCATAAVRTDATRARDVVARALEAENLSISDTSGQRVLRQAPAVAEAALWVALFDPSLAQFAVPARLNGAFRWAARDAMVQGAPRVIGTERRADLDAALADCAPTP